MKRKQMKENYEEVMESGGIELETFWKAINQLRQNKMWCLQHTPLNFAFIPAASVEKINFYEQSQ
jgi:hypothetical protein